MEGTVVESQERRWKKEKTSRGEDLHVKTNKCVNLMTELFRIPCRNDLKEYYTCVLPKPVFTDTCIFLTVKSFNKQISEILKWLYTS